MRGKLMKSRFSLIITFLCFGSLLTSLIWSSNNAELNQIPLHKKDIHQLADICQGCREVAEKGAESNSEILNLQEDKPKGISRRLSNVEPQLSESCKDCRVVNKKGSVSNTEILKKQEDKPKTIRKFIKKVVVRRGQNSKKQDDSPPKIRKVIEEKSGSNSEISKTQEDKPPKIREVIVKAEQHKKEDNPQKKREVTEKETESESEISKTQEDKPPRIREVIDETVERKPEDGSRKIREVIEKGIGSNLEISKTQEDKPPRIREVINEAVEPKQEDDSKKIRAANEKGSESNSEIMKKQEEKLKQNREVINEAVEPKQEEDSQKIRAVNEKGSESNPEIMKKHEEKLKTNREVINEAVEPKQEDDSQNIRKVIEKGTGSNSGISKTQKDKPRRIRKIIKKVVVRRAQNSKKDSPPQIREENKVEEHRSENSNTKEDDFKKIREIMDKALEGYSQTWKKQEDNYQNLRSKLSNESLGLDKAIFTQNNKPVGSEIVYDGHKKTLQVTPELFSMFTKDHPLSNKTWDTCAVVGNGGILTNSSCGEMIDSAQFVIRCNLAPLGNEYKKHVGIKTDFVTANPSIFNKKFGDLMGRRRPFVESLRTYGDSLLLIPAFTVGSNTPVSLRAFYTIEDFESPIRPVFLNPEYMKSLLLFWRSHGLSERRLSTGLFTASLALELCNNVHLYGFWPFSNHPHDLHPLTNHYYDDIKPKKFHVMPAEFDLLMRLHSQGIIKLHLENCPTGGN